MRAMFDRVRSGHVRLPEVNLAAARDYLLGAAFTATLLFLGFSLWDVAT